MKQILRKIVLALLILLSFCLQNTIFERIPLGGIVPNLTIILTSAVGFMRGEKEGLLTGFFCGLLSDIFFGTALGLLSLIFRYIGFLNGKFSRIFYPEDIKLPICLIVVSDITYGVLCYMSMFLVRGRLDFVFYLRNVILPEALYTILVTVVYYPLILLINAGLEKRERRSAREFV